MITKNTNPIKLIITIFFFILGSNLIYQGNLSLYKSKKISSTIQSKNLNEDMNINLDMLSNLTDDLNDIQKKDIPVSLNDKKFENKIIIKVKKNDTFFKIINPFFESDKIKNLIIQKLNKEYNLKNLKIGQEIFFHSNKEDVVTKIIMPINFSNELIVDIKFNEVAIYKEQIEISKETNSLKFNILSSIYEDGISAGLPLSILTDLIKLYSFDIDFQRDIKKNTKLEISYEVLFNSKRNITSYGNIKYINLIFKKNNIEYFLFKDEEKYFDFYNKDGKNVKKSLLKTPIDGAKLSSNFGMRKHPISGYNKLHKGVDFAASTGTPIFAGGDGIIEYRGYNGGYGKYIKIRHNNEYKTAYAHLSSFKKNVTKGTRVNQGDVIGFVGSTGNSTGPHLHYEIIYKNKQINPMTMKLPSGKVLEGNELIRFKKEIKKIYAKHLFNLYE